MLYAAFCNRSPNIRYPSRLPKNAATVNPLGSAAVIETANGESASRTVALAARYAVKNASG